MLLNNAALLRHQAFIGGEWVDAHSGNTFPVYDPATGNEVARVADCAPVDVERAIAAAAAAFEGWRARTAAQRANLLWRWYELILAHAEDLALIMTTEQGKPLSEARGEVRYAASFVEWFAEEARRVYGDIIPPHGANMRLLVFKEPVGVVAAITPWNFPCAMITRKVAPALAAGCTVVVKPSEETPVSALALAALAEQAGFPTGVFNVVTGLDADAIGQVLTQSPIVRKLSFTGSTAVGKLLMRRCADTVKRISLELGGNAPFIVFDDADVEAAVEGAITSKFRNSGQTCICANRLFVQRGVYEPFVEKFTEAVRRQKVGPGTEPGVTIGPLINRRALDKVTRLLSDVLQKGARVRTGGAPCGGTFFEPTVVTEVQPNMALMEEEIFGPIAPIICFDTEEEVIRLANDTSYGLAAYFYGRDVGRVFRVAAALEYGMVGVNTGILGTAVAPFGGVKQSGIGREGSKYGIDEFVELKYVCVAGL